MISRPSLFNEHEQLVAVLNSLGLELFASKPSFFIDHSEIIRTPRVAVDGARREPKVVAEDPVELWIELLFVSQDFVGVRNDRQ